jgi:hypothetical protein
MIEPLRISIANGFSPVPAGRYYSDGKFTGQKFREEIVKPRLKLGQVMDIDLDGVESLPSSFWEEVFGGLIREGFSADELKEMIQLRTTDDELEPYKELAWKFVSDEVARQH